MKAQFLTDRGLVREHNEDSGGIYYNSSGQALAIIADGMGGHKAGDIASEMSVSIVESEWQDSNEFSTPDQTEKWLSMLLEKVNKSIYDHALEREEYQGMGTTIVVTIITEDFITIAHIGDSRCYIYNESGFKQITEDHSLVNELLRSGQITKEEANNHPRKNVVLKALGTEEGIKADLQSIGWENGNKLLLCSDGLTDKISNEELTEFFNENYSLKEMGQNMIDLANERGGEDNISLIIISQTGQDEMGENPC